MAPLVSVVMSVRDGERYLPEAMDSILAQTWGDFECIVVDDGSHDGTGSILERYARSDRRVKWVPSPAHGLPAALTVARQYVHGKYIARMDADDVCLAYRLEHQVRFLEEHREVALLGGAFELMREDDTVFGIVREPLTNQEIQAALLRRNCFGQITVMMRVDSYDEVGGYREPFLVAEDYDLWMRLADHHILANLPEVLTRCRIHAAQTSLRTLVQQALCALAIRRATQLRRLGQRDPITPSTPITRALVVDMGIAEEDIDNLVLDYHWHWFELLHRAQYAALARRLLEAAVSFSETARITRSQRSRLHRQLARLSLEQGDLGQASLSAWRAWRLQPMFPARMLWHRLAGGTAFWP